VAQRQRRRRARPTSGTCSPWVTFTSPEVARVGLSEAEAKAQGIAYEVTRYGLDDLDRAIADSDAHGFVKVLTPPGKDRILGVTENRKLTLIRISGWVNFRGRKWISSGGH
jgi:pyruvate/2-oxoglutarate dehydrogenase complex dihydrolipoamide dehydrogenase (E3) component